MKCRFRLGDLLQFDGTFLAFAVPAAIGTVTGGFGWSLVGWGAFCLIYFELWAIRILCCHCPYYAERSRTLHCYANYGSVKVWKYRPEPMNASERTQFVVSLVILCGYPFPFLLLGGQFVWTLVALGGLAVFVHTMRRHVCPRCVNFSCPLNSVPKKSVDAYLKRNPVMLQAWKESGSRPGPER